MCFQYNLIQIKIKFQTNKTDWIKKSLKKEHNELVKYNKTLEISIACYKILKNIFLACYTKVYSTFL